VALLIRDADSRSAGGSSKLSATQAGGAFLDPDNLTSGMTVYIPSLGRDGVVQGSPNSKGDVPVLSQSMRLVVNVRDLEPAGQIGSQRDGSYSIGPGSSRSSIKSGSQVTRQVLRKSGHMMQISDESDRVVDLRGLTSDEAISQLEVQLDAASLADEDRLKVIHGHGTESLKRSVRGYLSRSVYVKKWLAGTPETGGDGITWVELK
jgi:DNA mismatch repair protein MutS2